MTNRYAARLLGEVRLDECDPEDEARRAWLDKTMQPIAQLALGPVAIAELVDEPESVGRHGRRPIPRLGLKDRGERIHVQRVAEVAR